MFSDALKWRFSGQIIWGICDLAFNFWREIFFGELRVLLGGGRFFIQFLPHSHPIIAQLGEDWGGNWVEKRKTTETDTTYTTTTTTTTTTNTANKEGARAKGGQ